MPWLVDGMNVIGSRPDGWGRDRTAAVRRLLEAPGPPREDVWVVLDGRERDLGDVPAAVHVVWAPEPGPNAADRVIAGLVEEDSDPSRWRVVTSDRALAERVRATGATVVGAREFAEKGV